MHFNHKRRVILFRLDNSLRNINQICSEWNTALQVNLDQPYLEDNNILQFSKGYCFV